MRSLKNSSNYLIFYESSNFFSGQSLGKNAIFFAMVKFTEFIARFQCNFQIMIEIKHIEICLKHFTINEYFFLSIKYFERHRTEIPDATN